MFNYFDKFSVAQWIEQYIKVIIKAIKDFNKRPKISLLASEAAGKEGWIQEISTEELARTLTI